jgi:hypothetical protein
MKKVKCLKAIKINKKTYKKDAVVKVSDGLFDMLKDKFKIIKDEYKRDN